MATETQTKFTFPTIFGINQEIKKNPNYRPQFSNQPFPHLSSSIPNPKKTLLKIEKSIPSISFSDSSLDSGPTSMGEEPTRVARSVAAACLLDHFAKTEPVFTPFVSDMMVAYLNRCHLITPSEKEALLKAAGESEEDSENEKMISAIGKALLSIEKDTGAVTCFLAPILDDDGKNRVFALSIRPEILVKEILPISLRFQDLSISPTYINDAEEYERQKQEKIRELDSKKKRVWIKCHKYITKPTPARRVRSEAFN